MSLLWLAVGLVPSLLGLDRALLWMEGRGWIYYRRSKSGGSLSNALMGVEAIFEPNKQHLVAAKQDARRGEVDEGGPDDPTRALRS